MATKYLARTIIEGGRSAGSKYQRRHSTKEENARLRNFLRQVAVDPELADEIIVKPRAVASIDFDDRLGPARKWLHSRIGERWDDVYSELHRVFDPRTVPGRHIIKDHILRDVDRRDQPPRPWMRYDFFVDEDGVLRARIRAAQRRESASSHWYYSAVPPRVEEMRAWLKDRKVGQRGAVWFWFEPTKSGWVSCAAPCRDLWRPHCESFQAVVCAIGGEPTVKKVMTHWRAFSFGGHRQGQRMTADEIATWQRFAQSWFGDHWNDDREKMQIRFMVKRRKAR